MSKILSGAASHYNPEAPALSADVLTRPWHYGYVGSLAVVGIEKPMGLAQNLN